MKHQSILCIALIVLLGGVCSAAMPLPTGQDFLVAIPFEGPQLSEDPATASPLGIGSLARGGQTFDVRIGLGPFDGPVDIFVALYAPKLLPDQLIFIWPDSSVHLLSDGLVPWRTDVAGGIDHPLWGELPASLLPDDEYYFYVLVAPSAERTAAAHQPAERTAQQVVYQLPPQHFYVFVTPMVISRTKAATLEVQFESRWPSSLGDVLLTYDAVIPLAKWTSNKVVGVGGGDLSYSVSISLGGLNCNVNNGTGDMAGMVRGSVSGSTLGIAEMLAQYSFAAATLDCPGIGSFPFSMGDIVLPYVVPPTSMPFVNGATKDVTLPIGEAGHASYTFTIRRP